MSETEGRLPHTGGWSAQIHAHLLQQGSKLWNIFFLFTAHRCKCISNFMQVYILSTRASDLTKQPKQTDKWSLKEFKKSCFFSHDCSTAGHLNPWSPLSYRLLNGLNGVKIETQGKQSMLVFFNVSEEDYGNYTCVAMNTMGITNASIILYGKNINAKYTD